MNVDALSSQATVKAALLASASSSANPTAAQLAADRQSLTKETNTKSGAAKTPTPAEVKKAASQFEAIILRQLLAPTIEPVMSGGAMGGGGASSSGGGVYGYMLTDVMANSLAQGGGLGWAKMLEKQLSPATAAHQPADGAAKK
ncbi:MAG TPA: hypothetical protein VFT72_18795 [Opitutaceae bacterium]|nr:hypothetical protein [Opitutaceae bacterium]